MACEVCHHCDTSVEPREAAVHDGLSYHRRCHKCYVCGETDLRDAETFQGVIFCAGCSQRIFQGCSTARQAKFLKNKRKSSGARQRRRRRNEDRVLAMTINTGNYDSPSSASAESKRKVYKQAPPSPPVQVIKDNCLKKNSADCSSAGGVGAQVSLAKRGTSTDVTHDILKRAEDQHIVQTIANTPAKSRKKRKTHKREKIKKECSDLRIAELGASVEIAHMALRNQSEKPVIIKSESHLKNMRSRTLSNLNQESDLSSDSNNRWKESFYSTEGDSEIIHWTQRTVGSILKIPLKCFKRNILDRSSLVSVTSSEAHESSAMKKFRTLFNKDVTEHQRHGLKKLYSTINRKNTPCKLGWLHLNKSNKTETKRCKHFNTSHSYRCMRQQVMRLAGPTRSELAILRGKILSIVSPSNIKKIVNYNKKYEAILSIQARRRS